MVGIIASPVALHASDVADLVAMHLRLLSTVDDIAAGAVTKPETKDIGLQLKLAADVARATRSKSRVR